eukprot:UN04937
MAKLSRETIETPGKHPGKVPSSSAVIEPDKSTIMISIPADSYSKTNDTQVKI